jgi:glycosyltransferase involved in cell wall biosynthesis
MVSSLLVAPARFRSPSLAFGDFYTVPQGSSSTGGAPSERIGYRAATVNVLFLSIDFVYPPDRGLRVRSFSQLRVLSSMPAVESVTFLSMSDKAIASDRLRALEGAVGAPGKLRVEPVVVQPGSMRRSPRQLPRLLRLRAQGVPYLVAKHDTTAMRELVERELRARRYDVVYVGHLAMCAYLPTIRRLAPTASVVLEQHNVEWEIFDRLAPTLRGPMRYVGKIEAQSLRSYERKALSAVDSVIAISTADALAFERLAGIRAVVVPTFIERTATRTETTDAKALAYTGLLAWQPNALGLDWFCKDVWPLVRAGLPEATLTIAGPGLRKTPDGALAVPALWQAPGITTVGYVDDLEDVYRKSVAVIAPIIGGSGVRMKLLEAMRAGMPTVTTTDGAAGLDVQDGREMLIADDAKEFASRVVKLLNERALRSKMREAGYAFLEKHHSLAAARVRVEEAFAAAASKRKSVAS